MTVEFWIQTIRTAPVDWIESRLAVEMAFLTEAKVILPRLIAADGLKAMVSQTKIDVQLMQDELARRKSG